MRSFRFPSDYRDTNRSMYVQNVVWISICFEDTIDNYGVIDFDLEVKEAFLLPSIVIQ
jgi:hypothetical protein